jgi:hypothetical protein
MILGIGGLERWVVYPIVLWTLSFGGWLDGQAAKAADDPGPAILGA